MRAYVLMRFATYFSAYRADLPDWLVTLAMELERGGDQASSATTGLVAAISDLETLAGSISAGHEVKARTDRESVRNDLRLALESVGPNVAAAARPIIADLNKDLARLPEFLAEPNGAVILRASTQAILTELSQPALSVAAWSDAYACFEADEDAETRERRIRQLCEFVTIRGAEWRSIARRIKGLLFNERLAFVETGVLQPPDDSAGWQVSADFALELRLDYVSDVLRKPSEKGELIGWACFAPASLGVEYARRGAVELFSDTLWPEGIIHGRADLGLAPAKEFEDDWYTYLFREMPESPFVLVRVPMGRHAPGGADDRVRRIAADLVRVARPHSKWALIDGAPVFLAGDQQGWFGKPFSAGSREREAIHQRLRAPSEISGDLIREVDEATVAGLLADESRIVHAVRDIEWAEAVAAVPNEAQRLALGVRLVERLLPAPLRETWAAATERYLKRLWQDQMSKELIVDVAQSTVEILEGPIPTAGQLNPWRDRLTPATGPRTYQVNLRETLLALPEILALLDRDSMQRALIRQLAARAESPNTWLEYLRALGQEFERLVQRAARQRNAVVHGADTDNRMVQSVSYFVRWLENVVVHRQLDAATAGEEVLPRLERENAVVRAYIGALNAGVPVVDAVFPD
jgi:hypothetical protein